MKTFNYNELYIVFNEFSMKSAVKTTDHKSFDFSYLF